ncbi:MAG: HAMP domain-containing sensor histidine kinase [Polyangiaceae bacterium]
MRQHAERHGAFHYLHWYFRARLHRKIFLFQVVMISVTAGMIMGVHRLVQSGTHHGAYIFGAGIFCLWIFAGFIAHRVSRDWVEIIRVAEDLGRGKLKSRVQLERPLHGESHMLARVLNDMATRIEKQLADQRALLATVSHEIRTPLARLRLLVELTREKLGQASTPAEIEEIDKEVVEIDALVADLLASSRIDFSAMSPKELDAVEVARQAMRHASVDPARLEAPSTVVAFEGDATLTTRAVTNLIENARRHGGGVARVTVGNGGPNVRIEVEDDGPGFLPGEENRIFEPFYRRPSVKAEAQSLGLGLALVQRIAEAHGGRAYARNREGGGALVGVELPAWHAPPTA